MTHETSDAVGRPVTRLRMAGLAAAAVVAVAGPAALAANALSHQDELPPATIGAGRPASTSSPSESPATAMAESATPTPVAAGSTSSGTPATAGTPAASASPTAGAGASSDASPSAGATPRFEPVVIDEEWLATNSRKTGISRPALRAYAAATLALRRENPDCRITWNTLAGVGWIESHNGTIDGRTVRQDGTVSRPILGPRLDGKQFAAIPDTDGGRYDGDVDWDRAMGPLQFLPSTWERYGRDGTGDGLDDPQNIDDAALTAATYLCADGFDLTTGKGWSKALFGYNHSDDYVDSVRNAANEYAARSRAPEQQDRADEGDGQ